MKKKESRREAGFLLRSVVIGACGWPSFSLLFFCRPSLRLCVRPSSQPFYDPFSLLPLCRSMMELNYRRVPRWNRRHVASEQARVVTSHAIIVRELQWRPRANIGTRKISRNRIFQFARLEFSVFLFGVSRSIAVTTHLRAVHWSQRDLSSGNATQNAEQKNWERPTRKLSVSLPYTARRLHLTSRYRT